MALVKTVEMRVLAKAGDAQAKLDELAAEADKLGSDGIRMRFRMDDAEGKAQLDDIKARADALGFKDVSIKVKVDGAGRAIADLAAVKHEEEQAGGGILGKIGSMLSGAGGGIPLIGGAGPAGIAALIPVAAALLVEVTGVVSGFAAAGAGAGAFALLAEPSVKKVQTAYEALNTAQQKYSAAQAKEAADPTKANANAVAAAGLNLKLAQESIGKMPADEQAAIRGIQGLSREFGNMSKAFQPEAFKVFASGLQLLKDNLPGVMPFATTFATVFSKLLDQADRASKSQGFKNFLSAFHGIEGPALNSIGQGLGGVAKAIGGLLTTMSGKDVAHSINIAFGAISGTINGIAGTVKYLMQLWDGAGIAARQFGHDVAAAFHSVANTFDTVRHGFAETGHSWASSFDNVRHDIAAKFDGIKGAIESKFAGAAAWLLSAAHNIANAFDHVRHDIAAWFDGVKDAVVSKFAGAGSWLLSAGKSIIQGLINGISSMLGPLAGIVSRAAGIVKSIAGHLGIHSPSTVMHGYGVNIVQGLIAGMNAQLPALEAMAARAAKIVADRVKTEIAFAKNVSAATMSGLGLTSIDLTQGTVASGMQSYLASIKAFIAELKQLSSQHLNKSILQQLIAAGPVTGGQYAMSILQGGGVAQVNSLYKQIQQQSQLLGAQAASSVYGGKVAPKGDTYTINVSGGLITDKQALALEIIKVLRQYKRQAGGAALGIA